MSDIEISLDDPNTTLFKYVQQLTLSGPLQGRADRLKRIWEPTYTLIYRDANTPASQPRRKENSVVSRTMPRFIFVLVLFNYAVSLYCFHGFICR